MAETPNSPVPQDDQAAAPRVLGSYGAPASSEGQAPGAGEPEASAAEPSPLPLVSGSSAGSEGSEAVAAVPSPVDSSAVTSYAVTSAPGTNAAVTSSGEAWSATVAAEVPIPEPEQAAAAADPAPVAASYAAASYGGGSGASPAAASTTPTIGSSIHVPPLDGDSGEGGEWDLLSGKLRDWFDRHDLAGQWERLGGPLRASGLLVGGLILIKVYEALLDALDDIPLLPRLLELAGLLYLINFGFTHLIKSQDRENLINAWKKSWHDFAGRP